MASEDISKNSKSNRARLNKQPPSTVANKNPVTSELRLSMNHSVSSNSDSDPPPQNAPTASNPKIERPSSVPVPDFSSPPPSIFNAAASNTGRVNFPSTQGAENPIPSRGGGPPITSGGGLASRLGPMRDDVAAFSVSIGTGGSRVVSQKNSSSNNRKRASNEHDSSGGKRSRPSSVGNYSWLRLEHDRDTTEYSVRDKFSGVKVLHPPTAFNQGETLYLGFASLHEAEKALENVTLFEQDTRIELYPCTPPGYGNPVPNPFVPRSSFSASSPPAQRLSSSRLPLPPPVQNGVFLPPRKLVLSGFDRRTKVSHIRRLLKTNGWDQVRPEDIRTTGDG